MIVRSLIRVVTSLYRNGLQANHFSVSSKRPVLVTFKTADGDFRASGALGESLLDVVVNADLPLDGYGACEGTLACCTCHVILEEEHFNRLAPPGDEELDMLDLAPDLHEHSRLGCQVILSAADGDELSVVVPSVRRDARTLS